MPFFEDPEEGPVTTDHFLKDKPAQAAASQSPAPQAAAEAPIIPTDISNEELAERSLNEQGLLTASQRSQMLRGILWQIPLFFAIVFASVFLVACLPGRGGHSSGLSSLGLSGALAIAAIVCPIIVLVLNFTQLVDLWRGKVLRAHGDWSTRTEGSIWLKTRRTINTIGGTEVKGLYTGFWVEGKGGWWNIRMWFIKDPFSEGIGYIAYYLPISKIIVSYQTVSDLPPEQGQDTQIDRISRNEPMGPWALWIALASGIVLLTLIFSQALANNSPYSQGFGLTPITVVPGSTYYSYWLTAVSLFTSTPMPTDTPIPVTARLLRTYSGHSRSVSSVAFSPDGKTILTGSDDDMAKLWDISDLVGTTSTATP